VGRFKFKFENIKTIKESLEKKIEKELALINLEIKKKEDKIKEIFELKLNRKKDMLNNKKIKGSELHFHSTYDKTLDSRIEELRIELNKLKKNKEEKIAELTEKSKEVKMFELLKEKHKADFMQEERRFEQKEFDDIATKRFARGN